MNSHDVTSPRPYSRIHMVSGTKAFAQKWPRQCISTGHSWFKDDQMKEIEKKYTPEIITKIGELAKRMGGHGEWSL